MHVAVIIFLTVLWVLLWGSFTPLIIAGGLLVAILIVTVFPFPAVTTKFVFRPAHFAILVGRFLFDLLLASFQVAWLAIRPAEPPRSALIEIPLVSRSELLQTITAELVCLVPGTLLIDLDPEGKRMWLHLLNASTPELVEKARRSAAAQEGRVLAALGSRQELREFKEREVTA